MRFRDFQALKHPINSHTRFKLIHFYKSVKNREQSDTKRKHDENIRKRS